MRARLFTTLAAAVVAFCCVLSAPSAALAASLNAPVHPPANQIKTVQATQIAQTTQTVAAQTASTSQPAAEQNSQLQVTVKPMQSTLSQGENLKATLSITNTSAQELSSAQVQLYVSKKLLTSTTQVRSWFESGNASDGTRVAVKVSDPIPAHASVSIDLNLDADKLATWAFRSQKGVLGFGAQVTAGGLDGVWAPTSFVWNTKLSDIKPLSVVVPITAPAPALPDYTPQAQDSPQGQQTQLIPEPKSGLYSVSELGKLTAADGMLTKQLKAIEGADVLVAVDPRIVQSIKDLGGQAPQSATDWLAKLNKFDQRINLLWADASPALLASAGLTSLNGSLLPEADQSKDTPTLAVPDSATVDSSGMKLLTSSSQVSAIVANINSLNNQDADIAPVTVDGKPVIGQNDNLTDALDQLLAEQQQGGDQAQTQAQGAAGSGDAADLNWLIATANVLGINAKNLTGIALVLPRDWSDNSSQAGQLLQNLKASDRVSLSGKLKVTGKTKDAPTSSFKTSGAGSVANSSASPSPSAIASASASASASAAAGSNTDAGTDAADTYQSISQPQSTLLQNLKNSLAAVQQVASVSENPQKVTDAGYHTLANLAAPPWLIPASRDDTWNNAVTAQTAANNQLLNRISITSTTNLTLISGSSNIPVTVQNLTSQKVTVKVAISPSNGRIRTPDPATLTLDPGTAGNAKIPVRAIANGKVDLRIHLTNTKGDTIGQVVVRPMEVNAQWETIGLAVIGVLLLLILVGGLVYSVMTGKKEKKHRIGHPEIPLAEPKSTFEMLVSKLFAKNAFNKKNAADGDDHD